MPSRCWSRSLLLAVPGLLALRRGAANGFWLFSIVFFGFFMLLGWFYWSALDLGIPGPLTAT